MMTMGTKVERCCCCERLERDSNYRNVDNERPNENVRERICLSHGLRSCCCRLERIYRMGGGLTTVDATGTRNNHPHDAILFTYRIISYHSTYLAEEGFNR